MSSNHQARHVIGNNIDIEKIQIGDREEIKRLVRSISSWVYHPVFSYLQNVQEAEEVTQDCALKVLEVLMDVESKNRLFEGRSSLKTWSYSIAINKARDLIKYKSRDKRKAKIVSIDRKVGHQPKIDLADHSDPQNALESKEKVSKIWTAIASLPDTQKEVLILAKIDHNSIKEVAEILGTTPKAAESLLSRAKQNLKKRLGNDSNSQDR